ncbi:Elongation factor G-like protein [uncultured Alphaproteobacteria bacterium]|uniref:Elongation factor G n=1 Tax=uncultured Alphaproteobacteria bacterium TaxID=91750 RepID=A0A212JWB0_9PROT|nr:Elongation factor G-like protein [uncultured Alphaproteobacteria bacterium]
MPDNVETTGRATRVAAIVGPYTSGKTSLMEALLSVSGGIARKGSAADRSRVGDWPAEAKSREMSTEAVAASTTYLDDPWTFIDCPGSVEFLQDTRHALMVCDIAVVVCDPDPTRAVMVSPYLKFLDDHEIPHLIFINRIEHAKAGHGDILEALQAVSERPLVMRQMPIVEGENVTGFVDLIHRRAYHYEAGKPSTLMSIPAAVAEDEQGRRQEVLESLADFDDALMEELLNDAEPATDDVFASLKRDLAANLVVPVLCGEAERDHGITRLWKTLRHDAPDPAETWERRKAVTPAGVAQVFKSQHAQHTGRLAWLRAWEKDLTDGMTLAGQKIGGLYTLQGSETAKAARIGVGGIAAVSKLETVKPGDVLTEAAALPPEDWPRAPQALFALKLSTVKAGDDVKLSTALAKLVADDVSLAFGPNPDTGELLLWGMGEVHLMNAVDRLRNAYNVEVKAERPTVPFKETIRKGCAERGRHKRQTGGHGQFGDVMLEVRPQGRGEGFAFTDRIVGGVVPKNYIPAVEAGVRESLVRGPLGFPVVDVAVTLTDGSYHTVDSSEMAFKTAAGIGMRAALPKCEPILLEPIWAVSVAVPSEWTSKAQRALSQRRAQILGYDKRPGWTGWDVIKAQVPQMEVHDLILELRSLTMGVGTFEWVFDHLQELTGRAADKAVADNRALTE